MSYITKERLKEWLIASFIRAIRTAAQAAVSLIGTNAMGITEVQWAAVASASALAAVVSLLMAIAGLPEVDEGKDLAAILTEPEGKHVGGNNGTDE